MASGVFFVSVGQQRFVGHIHLASENRFERFFAFVLALGVDFVDVVEEFFYAEHVAMVGNGKSRHAVGYGFVYQRGDRSLTVKHGKLGVDV